MIVGSYRTILELDAEIQTKELEDKREYTRFTSHKKGIINYIIIHKNSRALKIYNLKSVEKIDDLKDANLISNLYRMYETLITKDKH